MTSRLEEHLVTFGEESLHQHDDFRLQQRLTAGDLDEAARVPADLRHYLIHGAPLAAGERIRRIAPAASQIAGRETHEHARPPDVRGFALDGQIDFVDGQHGVRSLQ